MKTDNVIYMLHCMTPVHVGAGQGVGAIDMPMIREKVTQWPYIPGSSIKGVHRDYFRNNAGLSSDAYVNIAFGKESSGSDTDGGAAGALVMSDARILVFPVASGHGTFAYVTCPLVLKRLHRDLKATHMDMPGIHNILDKVNLLQKTALVHEDSKLLFQAEGTNSGSSTDTLSLDEFKFEAEKILNLRNGHPLWQSKSFLKMIPFHKRC